MYEECPYSFYFKKLDDTKEGMTNAYAEAGKFAHEILADIFKKEITIQEGLDRWIDEYYDYVGRMKQETKDKKFEEFANYLASLDLSMIESGKYKVLEVEDRSEWKHGKYNMIGYIDLLLEDTETGELILVDHKSLGRFMKKDNITPLKNMLDGFNAYKKQMYLYCMPIYEKYGK